MLNQIALLCIFFFSSLTIIGQSKSGMIPWEEETKLKWSDFKGKANKMSNYEALTYAGIEFQVGYQGNDYQISIVSTFDKKSSWTKEKKDAELLQHEQLHFDITELYARKFRRIILEKNFKTTGKDLIKEIQKINKEIGGELKAMQNQYDKQSNHSNNKKMQKYWEEKIYTELKELKKFKETEIKFKL